MNTKPAREEAIAAVAEAFRQYGYDGASLSRLSKATGLGRSSLYHHFPNGKEDMAKAAVEHVSALANERVITPLTTIDPPAKGVEKALSAIADFYRDGQTSCLIDFFGINDAANAAPGAACDLVEKLEAGFFSAAQRAGVSRAQANGFAEETTIALEGALVVARAKQDTGPFTRTLKRIKATFDALAEKSSRK